MIHSRSCILGMGFFSDLFKTAAPANPDAPATPDAPTVPTAPVTQFPPIPPQLPNITAPTAAQITQTSNPSPAAQQILAANPNQTPSQYLGALQQKNLGGDMVSTLAHGLPDKEGVSWATQSADKVSTSLPPTDVQANAAAKAWAANPTSANQAAASAAAANTNMQGPGALAAQGAAWAQPSTPATSAAAGAPATPRLTPHAVAGSVLLSSAVAANPKLAAAQNAAPSTQVPQVPTAPAIPQMAMSMPAAPAPTVPPAVQAKTFQQQYPFIAIGLAIAGKKVV
jgi:hypothetical protein